MYSAHCNNHRTSDEEIEQAAFEETHNTGPFSYVSVW